MAYNVNLEGVHTNQRSNHPARSWESNNDDSRKKKLPAGGVMYLHETPWYSEHFERKMLSKMFLIGGI